MSFDFLMLVWSTALFGLYVGTQAIFYRMQHGVVFAATSRDAEPPPNEMTARSQKALRNLIETYPVFLALSVANLFAGQPDAVVTWGAAIYLLARVVYLPLYVFGVMYVRSLVWMVSAIGLTMMFLGVAF